MLCQPRGPLTAAVVATSKKNACVSLVFSFLYKVVQVGICRQYPSTPPSAHPGIPGQLGFPLTHPCPLSTQVFSEYFKELEEESIRDNFVIIYELLDELMDFGFPQTTDSKILQE